MDGWLEQGLWTLRWHAPYMRDDKPSTPPNPHRPRSLSWQAYGAGCWLRYHGLTKPQRVEPTGIPLTLRVKSQIATWTFQWGSDERAELVVSKELPG